MKDNIIAAFDFDGTITTKDTLRSFLFSFRPLFFNVLLLTSLFPFYLQYLLGIKSRDQMKEALLSAFLKGKTKEELENQGRKFSENYLPKVLRKKALKKIKEHKERGDLLILVSGSLSFYLVPWGKKEGFDLVLTPTLAFDENARFTGKLIGKNCWGEEKIVLIKKALRDTFSREMDFVEAYGDTKGDRALLEASTISHYKPFR